VSLGLAANFLMMSILVSGFRAISSWYCTRRRWFCQQALTIPSYWSVARKILGLVSLEEQVRRGYLKILALDTLLEVVMSS
jgi:hypothetical protein